MKEFIFHGGPITKDGFLETGCTFWTTNFPQARDYADDGEIYALEIDWAQEVIRNDEDFLGVRSYADAQGNEDNLAMQVNSLHLAIADGATSIFGDDGIAIVNVERLNPRRVTLAEAREIWEENF